MPKRVRDRRWSNRTPGCRGLVERPAAASSSVSIWWSGAHSGQVRHLSPCRRRNHGGSARWRCPVRGRRPLARAGAGRGMQQAWSRCASLPVRGRWARSRIRRVRGTASVGCSGPLFIGMAGYLVGRTPASPVPGWRCTRTQCAGRPGAGRVRTGCLCSSSPGLVDCPEWRS